MFIVSFVGTTPQLLIKEPGLGIVTMSMWSAGGIYLGQSSSMTPDTSYQLPPNFIVVSGTFNTSAIWAMTGPSGGPPAPVYIAINDQKGLL
ncbi:MAG: hypothetical protein WBF75_24160 [Pseudonocardiaceae bacterium]|jgi:hypothetical protein